jgi:T5orf172 domain
MSGARVTLDRQSAGLYFSIPRVSRSESKGRWRIKSVSFFSHAPEGRSSIPFKEPFPLFSSLDPSAESTFQECRRALLAQTMLAHPKIKPVIVNPPQNGPHTATGAEENQSPSPYRSGTTTPGLHSTTLTQESLEMPANAEAAPVATLDRLEDSPSPSSEGTGRKTNGSSVPSSRTSSTSQKQGTLTSWLKMYKSTQHVNFNSTKDLGADTKRQSETDPKRESLIPFKRDVGTDPNRPNPASDQLFAFPNAASHFTFRAPSPLNGASSDLKQTALTQDVRPLSDFLRSVSEPNPVQASPLEEAHPVRLSDRTRQHYRPLPTAPTDPSISKLTAAPPSGHSQDAAIPLDSSCQNLDLDRSLLHHGKMPPTSENSHRKQIREASQLSRSVYNDAARTGLLVEGEKASRPLQPETPVRSVKSDEIQSLSPIRAGKQDPQHLTTHQFLSPTTAASARSKSAPSTISSTPFSTMERRGSCADENPAEFHAFYSVSSPTGRTTPVPSACVQTPGSEKSDDYFGSSPPIESSHCSEDDYSSHRRESSSSALIRSPSPGGLDVIWQWTMTERRKRMLQGFYWIVGALCPDLTEKEIPGAHIYIFKVEDYQGKDYLKIGVAKTIEKRMKEHNACYGKCEQIYPPSGEKRVLISHAHRVERLVHAELVPYAVQLESCPKSRMKHDGHREWFDVDERHAIAVIQRWSEWMNSSPYLEEPIIGMDQKKRRNRKSTSGRSVRAKTPNSKSPMSKSPTPKSPTSNSTESRSLTAKSPNKRNSKAKSLGEENLQAEPATTPTKPKTRWRLKTLDPYVMLDTCWH